MSASALIAHFVYFVTFLFVVCTPTSKQIEKETKTLHDAFHCAHTSSLCVLISFLSGCSCNRKLTLCQQCKISFCCRQSARATIRPEQQFICHYFIVMPFGMRVAKQKNKESYVLQPSHRMHCFYYLLFACQFFDEKNKSEKEEQQQQHFHHGII